MLKVVIEPSQATPSSITQRSGTSTNGRAWSIRSQECWIYNPGSSFPRLYAINLADNIPLYPAGEYQLDVESMVQPNDFKGLSLSRNSISLISVAASASAPEPIDDKKPDFSKKFGA